MSVLFCQNPVAYFLLYDQHESLSNFLPRCISDNGSSVAIITACTSTASNLSSSLVSSDSDVVTIGTPTFKKGSSAAGTTTFGDVAESWNSGLVETIKVTSTAATANTTGKCDFFSAGDVLGTLSIPLTNNTSSAVTISSFSGSIANGKTGNFNVCVAIGSVAYDTSAAVNSKVGTLTDETIGVDIAAGATVNVDFIIKATKTSSLSATSGSALDMKVTYSDISIKFN